MKTKKAFTLIEVMVVIAIIGILASIVAISLKQAKDKANNSKIKAQLAQARNAAQIYYNTTESYTPGGNFGNRNSCNGPMFTDVPSGMNAIIHQSEYPYDDPECRHNATNPAGVVNNATEYAISAELSDGRSWCVDSRGYSGFITTPLGNNDTNCN